MPRACYAVRVNRGIGVYHTYNKRFKQVYKFPKVKEFIHKNTRNASEKKGNNSIVFPLASSCYFNRRSKYEFFMKMNSLSCDFNAPAHQSPTESSLNEAEAFEVTDVYTDGACTNNGATGAKAGIGIWFGPSHPLNVSAPLKGPPTNNNAEIQAARVAIGKAKEAGITRLRINTDSQFLVKCITEWIHRWKKNNWKCSSGDPVKNKDELEKLDSAVQSMEVVVWNHVRAHAGHLGNVMADKLAKDGARQYNPDTTSVEFSSDGKSS